MAKAKRRNNRHTFLFDPDAPGAKQIKAPCKVILARQEVDVEISAEHVRESMRRRGVGNTQTCSMAICTRAEAGKFPHPVVGYIDWTYDRAWVASKLRNGLPCECYEYMHRDDIARLNDSRNGQKKLLAQLERDGPRMVRLLPYKKYDHGFTPPAHRGKQDGSRRVRMRGAKLRAAVARLGGVPA